MSKGHAVAILVITPQGIPLVRDPKKPSPVYWKLPGGRSVEGETAEQCAVRELEQEVGVYLSSTNLEIMFAEDKGNHILTIFQSQLNNLPLLNSQGNEGEEVGVYTPRQILSMEDFFPNHLKVVKRTLTALAR